MFRWLHRIRRKRFLREGLSEESCYWLDFLPVLFDLPAADRKRLEGLTRVFIEEKHFEGCGGQLISDKIRVIIAAQACLLILNLHHDFYQRVRTILVYPSTFKHGSTWRRPDGIVVDLESANLGEAWPGGPVILAWDAAYQGGRNANDGQNTVFHEFAHKLDMLDGVTDGIPPLTQDHEKNGWRAAFLAAYEQYLQNLQAGRPQIFDAYAATNPAEFFATASECFFELAVKMEAHEPRLYALLEKFYRQDPARRSRAVLGQ
jgi:MtfA peptidase